MLRFAWAVTLVPAVGGHSGSLWDVGTKSISPFLAVLELVRRAMWACLRVEYEHLSNSEAFRKVDFVPLHFHQEPADSTAAEEQFEIKCCGRQVLLPKFVTTALLEGMVFLLIVGAIGALELCLRASSA